MNQQARVDKCSADFSMISWVVLPSSRSTACYSVESSPLDSTINHTCCKIFSLCEKNLNINNLQKGKVCIGMWFGSVFSLYIVCGFVKTKCITVGEGGWMFAHQTLSMGKGLGSCLPLNVIFKISTISHLYRLVSRSHSYEPLGEHLRLKPYRCWLGRHLCWSVYFVVVVCLCVLSFSK